MDNEAKSEGSIYKTGVAKKRYEQQEGINFFKEMFRLAHCYKERLQRWFSGCQFKGALHGA